MYCTLVCLFNSLLAVNAFSHIWHLKGFTLVFWCVSVMYFSEKSFYRIWQVNGFSPECVRMRVARLCLEVANELQISHCNFIFWCAFDSFREQSAISISSETIWIWFYSYFYEQLCWKWPIYVLIVPFNQLETFSNGFIAKFPYLGTKKDSIVWKKLGNSWELCIII